MTNFPQLDSLIYFVVEREAVRLAREIGEPPPWSNDPLFQQYRFCNVNVQDDLGSRVIFDTITQPYAEHPGLIGNPRAARSSMTSMNRSASNGTMQSFTASMTSGSLVKRQTASPTASTAFAKGINRLRAKLACLLLPLSPPGIM
jgi:hypothetical protein